MSNLFGFNQAEALEPSRVPNGHYDAEQQLWIADDTSYAYDEAAPIPVIKETFYLIYDDTGPSVMRDFVLE